MKREPKNLSVPRENRHSERQFQMPRVPIRPWEWMSLLARSPNGLIVHVRRFAWVALATYTALSVSLSVVSGGVPGTLTCVVGYVIENSLIIAVTFGFLYAAAGALRPPRARATSPS